MKASYLKNNNNIGDREPRKIILTKIQFILKTLLSINSFWYITTLSKLHT